MKDAAISDVAKSYKEIEKAIRMTFAAETLDEDDVSEILALNLTHMNADTFNNFLFFYYSEVNKFLFDKISQ